eukprot:scaffold290226_cov31-Tisochrysis_lutea.AAC.4
MAGYPVDGRWHAAETNSTYEPSAEALDDERRPSATRTPERIAEALPNLTARASGSTPGWRAIEASPAGSNRLVNQTSASTGGPKMDCTRASEFVTTPVPPELPTFGDSNLEVARVELRLQPPFAHPVRASAEAWRLCLAKVQPPHPRRSQ